jgi:ATP-dependent Clp protease ATP-binding subunit ClpX
MDLMSTWNLPPFTFDGTFTINNAVEESPIEDLKIKSPKEIKAFLDQYVIGQEEAKRVLSVAVHNHYVRVSSKVEEDGIEIQKSNILMLGDSGSGKTLLVQTIAKCLDLPFVTVDATTLTPAGIVGADVEDIIKNLLRAANGDRERAERGIVYIDEIDKLSGSTMSKESHGVKGVLGDATQSSLLKLIEGGDVAGDVKQSLFSSSEETISTKNVLFICSGAFTGIEECVERPGKAVRQIGFNSNNADEFKRKDDAPIKIGAREIIKFGIMPELVGRLPVIVQLQPLTKNDLIRILVQPKNAIISQYKKLLNLKGITLYFTDGALSEIAQEAIDRGLGARGLRGVVERVMTDVIFYAPDDEYARTCTVTAHHIKSGSLPTFVLPNVSEAV